MSGRRETDSARARLLEVIGGVRRRWRTKVLLRGLAITLAAALLLFGGAAWALEKLNFAESAIVVFRVIAALGIAGCAVFLVLLPLRRRVSDEQVALYLEEHEPTLQSTLISALEADGVSASPALARRTIEQAVEKCRAIEDGRRVDRRELNRFATAFAITAIAGVILTGYGPPLFRHGAGALLNPFGSAAEANPYRIAVTPGDATIARGADQVVVAALSGWESRGGAQQVEILMRTVGDSAFQRLPLTATENAHEFEVLLFDVAQPTEYYVEADGIATPLYRIDVADLPYVEQIELEYDYPEYTGLPNEVVEDGGDIIALRGTLVLIRARTTMPVAAARIMLDDGRAVRMQPRADGVLEGGLRVTAPGFYTIELTTADSVTVSGSARYLIDVIDDRGPSVRLSKPGHDIRPTTVEEVFVEVSAEDDFGVAKLELVYSINGGEERSIPLVSGGRPLPEMSAGHTFYLEELELQPGDLVSYFARATDNGGVNARVATSDMFFMNVRPFGRDYRQADQPPGGGQPGQAQQQDSPGEMSQRQREIITATFNLIRDSAQYQPREYAENLNTIVLMQDRLREQVTTLATRMDNRQVTQDSMFAKIAQILPLAAKEMESALESLRDGSSGDALGAEQRSLQQLQRAEALFRDVQVAMQQQQQGGGGGGATPNAEDLADLFELERDKLNNQYETVQRGERQQQQNQAEVDAALERLRELARRQEQENERLRQQAAMRQSQQGGGGNAQSQRQLADETEQAARQLERLSRETQQPQLAEAARQLQQAADQMRRSAANARSGNTGDANNALNNLEEARRRLERGRTESLEQQTRDALERAEALAREQRAIADRMNRLQEMSGDARRDEARRTIDAKEQQLQEVAELERQLDRLAASTRGEQRDASRRLQEAANSIRDNMLKERIAYSRNYALGGGNADAARTMEGQIGAAIDEMRERLQQANTAVAENPQQRTEEALDRLRRLARGLESLQERTRAAAEQGEGESNGQQGQPGQQQGNGQPGQQQNQPGQQQGQQGQPQSQQGNGQSGQQGRPGQQNGQSGQPGQQQGQQNGQQGQRGLNPQGGQQGGEGGPGGQVNMGGGGATGAVGTRGIDADDARQLRGEVRERLAEAQALRQQLAREGRNVAELDEVIRGMRALEGSAPWGNAEDLQRLQAGIVDRLKQYEFGLRRDVLGAERDRLFLSGSDEVPESYRRLVEEYYRALARERQ